MKPGAWVIGFLSMRDAGHWLSDYKPTDLTGQRTGRTTNPYQAPQPSSSGRGFSEFAPGVAA